jgi:NAD(P)-dependent dehydrogenase (short-subunit alcohol dehydrogenase family)
VSTILITGCRSGFGLVTAVEAARRGHIVYAGLRDLDTAEALSQATTGQKVIPIQLDVTVAEQREAAVARILSEQGGSMRWSTTRASRWEASSSRSTRTSCVGCSR